MKIAVITDDGKSISQHFGGATYYLVATVEDRSAEKKELRDKLGHKDFSHEHHHHEENNQPHGFGPESKDKHLRMSDAITDCKAILCGGMGRGAFMHLDERGIEPIVTDIRDIDQALEAYINGEIINLLGKLH